jgi:hypothetical protein
VIERVTGIRYSQTQTWAVLRKRLGRTRQRPARQRAVERTRRRSSPGSARTSASPQPLARSWAYCWRRKAASATSSAAAARMLSRRRTSGPLTQEELCCLHQTYELPQSSCPPCCPASSPAWHDRAPTPAPIVHICAGRALCRHASADVHNGGSSRGLPSDAWSRSAVSAEGRRRVERWQVRARMIAGAFAARSGLATPARCISQVAWSGRCDSGCGGASSSLRRGSGALGAELAEEAAVVGSDPLLGDSSLVVEAEDVHEVHDDPGAGGFEAPGG